MSDVRTYRGRGLEELIPKIRAELGDDAVVLRQREMLEGGMGGFFAKRMVEVDAAPARTLDVRDDEEASPFAVKLAAIEAELPPAPAHKPVVDERVSDVPGLEDLFPETGGDRDRLAALFQQGIQRDPVPEPLEQDAAAADPALLARLHEVAQQAEVIEETPVPADEPATEHADRDTPARAAAPAPSTPQVVVLGDDAPAQLEVLKDPAHRAAVVSLTERGISPELATDLVAEVVHHVMPLADDEQQLEPLLRGALAARIPVAHPRRGGTGRVVAFAGPAGAGKTRCVAALAVAYKQRSPLPVAVLGFRPKDGGAELQRLLAPVGVPLHIEEDAARARPLLEDLRREALVLVDLPGVAATAEAELRVLGRELSVLAPDEVHLTVPAPIGPDAGRELIDGLSPLRGDAIVLTHGDATRRLGTVVELAVGTGLPLSYVARGSSLQAGVRPANAEELALALVP